MQQPGILYARGNQPALPRPAGIFTTEDPWNNARRRCLFVSGQLILYAEACAASLLADHRAARVEFACEGGLPVHPSKDLLDKQWRPAKSPAEFLLAASQIGLTGVVLHRWRCKMRGTIDQIIIASAPAFLHVPCTGLHSFR